LEKARSADEAIGADGLVGASERVDGVGEGIDGIGVVEGLGTEGLVEKTSGIEGRAVVDVGIRLDDPD